MVRLLLVIVVSAGMARLGFSYFESNARQEANLVEIEADKGKLEAAWKNMEEFRASMDQVMGELADDEIKLPEAVELIENTAKATHPVYLRTLAHLKRPATLKERIAHNLVNHFIAQLEDQTENNAHLNSVLCRLKLQLAAMFPAGPNSARE